MQAEGQDEVPVVVTGHGYGEMVVDPFLQFVQDSQAIGGGKLGLRFGDGIGFARGSQRMNGHGGPLRQAFRSKYTEDTSPVLPSGERRRSATLWLARPR